MDTAEMLGLTGLKLADEQAARIDYDWHREPGS
jgi:hypothetical protein